MKTPLRRAATLASLLASLLVAPLLTAQIAPLVVPKNLLDKAPYDSTGILLTEFGPNKYRGSASVARDPRLLYTCAHVIYEDGIWTTSGEFGRTWNKRTPPTSDALVTIRGYRYFADYSGGNSERAFARDFAIGFRTAKTNFGPALPVMEKGGGALRDPSREKLIIGYPAVLEYFNLPGYYHMYRTGPYTASMQRVRDSYHIINGVSTGGGNSGGPVVTTTDNGYALAGILISGRYNGAGVYALNTQANSMADSLLLALDGTTNGNVKIKTTKNKKAKSLPDASKIYTERALKVSGLGPTAVSIVLDLRIATPFRGDLDVYVRSPSGRVHWVHQHALNRPGRDLVVKGADYRYTFYGMNPNGQWKLFMRDFYRGDKATFKKASLTVGTVKPAS